MDEPFTSVLSTQNSGGMRSLACEYLHQNVKNKFSLLKRFVFEGTLVRMWRSRQALVRALAGPKSQTKNLGTSFVPKRDSLNGDDRETVYLFEYDPKSPCRTLQNRLNSKMSIQRVFSRVARLLRRSRRRLQWAVAETDRKFDTSAKGFASLPLINFLAEKAYCWKLARSPRQGCWCRKQRFFL